MHNIVIKTERLLLHPLTVSDADAVYEWVSDERVTRYMNYLTYTSVKQVREWLVSAVKDSSTFHFGFERIADGKLIGSGDISPDGNTVYWRFGYNIRYDCQGNGYATEAAKAMMDYARREFGVTCFRASHAEPNLASGRVIEKCGLQFVRYGNWSKLDGSCKMRSMEYEREDHVNLNTFDIDKVYALLDAYKSGRLGGEKMPEDENPALDKSSKENYLFFTLPMALNYQRNSYTLWECANKTYKDANTTDVFDTKAVINMDEQSLRDKLVKYKVALQPNKQPIIWRTLCETIEKNFAGDIRRLFHDNDYSVKKIKKYIARNKKKFPYLGGNKICNYWLYVMEQYTDVKFVDRENITVAPDTHVIQSSQKLGIISPEEAVQGNVRELVAQRWQKILKGTELVPIDVHTPMWLWSRGKFSVEI